MSRFPSAIQKAESTGPLVNKLPKEGFSLNVPAILTLDQVDVVAKNVDPAALTIVSVFAGVSPIPSR